MLNRLKLLPDFAGAYGLVLFWCLVLFSGRRTLGDGDPFWHIRAGEAMLRRGEVLTQDIFSHTAFGREWIAHEWLSEVIMALIHRAAGLPGVVIFFLLIAALTFWLLVRLFSRYDNDWVALVVGSLALPVALSHLLARPHLFSWLLGVLTLGILQRGGRWLWLLPPLTAFWCNLHGGFLLSLVLQGIFLLGGILDGRQDPFGSLRQAFAVRGTVLATSLLAVGLNPFGYRLLVFPFQVTEEIFRTTIGEWLSPDFQGLWHLRLYVLLIVFLLFVALRRIDWTHRLLVLFFLNAGLTHARHFSVAALLLTPFFYAVLAPWLERLPAPSWFRNAGTRSQLRLSRASGPVAMLCLSVVLMATCGSKTGLGKALSGALFPLPEGYSRPALDFLESQRPPGKIFNAYTWGGYLLYGLEDPPLVFIDGRADMYGKEIFEDYLKASRLEEDPLKIFSKYGVTWVLWPPQEALTRYLGLHPGWRQVYVDDHVEILVADSADSS